MRIASAIILAGCVVSLGGSHAAWAAEESPAGMIRLMTYNIRMNTAKDGLDAWPHRRDALSELVKAQRPDVIGFQEVLYDQLLDLEKRLTDHAHYGVGRDDGKAAGEFAPIFYRRQRFELVDKGTFWLSDTPDKPGSVGWDAAITRIACWVKLKDKTTGTTLLAFNVHFDHRGQRARANGAKLLLQKIKSIAADAPAVLLGDFNATPSSSPYKIITEGDRDIKDSLKLTDARSASAAAPAGPDSTWNGFKQIVDQQRIDFLFVDRHWKVHSHRTLDEKKNGRFPSDHLPVVADVSAVK